MNMLRMIKLFGWETQMQDKIFEKREDELAWLWKNELLELINNNIKYVPFPYEPSESKSLNFFKLCYPHICHGIYIFHIVSAFWLETFLIILKVVSVRSISLK